LFWLAFNAGPALGNLQPNPLGGDDMEMLNTTKSWIAALTEIGLMLIALAIVASLLAGGTVPFFGGVVTNIVGLVKELGTNGLVGLIALGFIFWLFSKRTIA
jgi:hypothetical protein